MTFTETPFFILTFVVFVLWRLCRDNYRARVFVLLAGSLVFYAHDYWPLLALLLAYCVVDWTVGLWVARARRPGLVLTLGVTFNLLGLAYWKYTPLLLRTLAQAALALDLPVPAAPATDWVIPFGISFYA